MPDYVPSKEELRAALSLHHVCARLGIQLGEDDRAICPFHADTNPSFYLWEGDDDVHRWHCHPCGTGGDVFALLQRAHNVSFPEALLLAAEMLAQLPAGYEPPRRVVRRTVGPEDWREEVESARMRALRHDHAGILATRMGLTSVDDPTEAARWDAYLRGTWGWGISEVGTIYMPHLSPDGLLVGCKLRTVDGRKESLPGSRYEHLYGSWLGRRYRDALVTEGETDAVFAGWAAALEGVPLDVFALPSGASQPVDDAWLGFLRGVRVLYLALDPDDTGIDATRRWCDALHDAGFSEVRVCCLPLGRDLRDARPGMRHLLGSARRPLREPADIFVQPRGYIRFDRSNNPRIVATWYVEPTAQLVGGEEPGFDATLVSRGVKTRTILRLADLESTRSLNRWANRHGEIFTGTDADRQRVADRTKARGAITPEVYQTDRVGLHLPPPEYTFAGPTVVLPEGYLGDLPWRYAPSARAADVRGRVLLPAPGIVRWRWLEAILALSSSDVTHPLLAWLFAAARRPEASEFPLLFLGGSSGVGKSTLARIGTRLLGSRVEVDLGAVTPFILYRTLACSSSLPVLVDEWTRLSRADTREALQSIVPLLYSGGVAERGQADLSVARYRVTAPTIVAGEDTFSLDREIERMVCVYPTHLAQNHRALAFVQGQPVERIGHALHWWLTRESQLPDFPRTAPTRPEHNRETLLVGWATLRAFLDHAASLGESVPDLPAEPDLSCLARSHEDLDENVYETALVEGVALSDNSGLPVVWADPEGQGTWVRFVTLVGLLETRRMDVPMPGRSRAMRAYFTERYGSLQARVTFPPMGVRSVRAHLIPGYHIQQPEN